MSGSASECDNSRCEAKENWRVGSPANFPAKVLNVFSPKGCLPKGQPTGETAFKSLAAPRSGFLIRKTRPGGSSERRRVSEYLEESPRRLARPSKPKSWMFCDVQGVSSRADLGAGGHPRNDAQTPKSLALPHPFFLTRVAPV
jgi:hypothetical protein